MANNDNFIFRTILFPFQKGDTGIPATVDNIDAVRSDLNLLLNTRKRERVMLPDYGLDLERLVFENTGPLLRAKAFRQVSDAIGNWEPRVRIQDLQITEEEYSVTIDLYYSVFGINDVASTTIDREI